MSNNTFFKPTPLYKEFIILNLIEKNKDITQREISKIIGMSVSLVNNYMNEYENKGLIKRLYHSTKSVEYLITKLGNERKKILNIAYLNNSLEIFNSAKVGILMFLSHIAEKSFKKILLYGAGEVAEILLRSGLYDGKLPIEVVGIIDDDELKQNQKLVGVKIIPMNKINEVTHDGIMISSYTNRKIILQKLISINYPKYKILQFFE